MCVHARARVHLCACVCVCVCVRARARVCVWRQREEGVCVVLGTYMYILKLLIYQETVDSVGVCLTVTVEVIMVVVGCSTAVELVAELLGELREREMGEVCECVCVCVCVRARCVLYCVCVFKRLVEG